MKKPESHSKIKISRRLFAGRSTAATAASLFFPQLLIGDGISPNSKLNIAGVGVGAKEGAISRRLQKEITSSLFVMSMTGVR